MVMRTQDCNTTNNTPCTSAEQSLLDFITDCEAPALAKMLREVRDMALYHSDIPVEEKEKVNLLHIKLLADELEKL
jgi:hypothetical protein